MVDEPLPASGPSAPDAPALGGPEVVADPQGSTNGEASSTVGDAAMVDEAAIGGDAAMGDEAATGHEDADLGELTDDQVGGRRNALPRRVESWRSRSATGAIATAMAMGLQQVFEPERRRPAAVAEAPGDPYNENDPVTVDYLPDDAEGTRVHVKPWLLQREDPA